MLRLWHRTLQKKESYLVHRARSDLHHVQEEMVVCRYLPFLRDMLDVVSISRLWMSRLLKIRKLFREAIPEGSCDDCNSE